MHSIAGFVMYLQFLVFGSLLCVISRRYARCVIGFLLCSILLEIILCPAGEVRCTWQSPPMSGKSCCPAGEVRCTRQSPPMRGRSCWPSWSKSVVRDKVLRWGAHHVGLAGRSPLYVTKSSDEGHDLRGNHSQWRVIFCRSHADISCPISFIIITTYLI